METSSISIRLVRLDRASGGVSFVGRAERNHGVSATVAPQAGIAPFPAGLVTVALGGTRLLCSFVQEFPFYTAQNVAVLRPRIPMTFSQKLYICICIRANRFRYGAFGREANRTLRVLEIPKISEFPSWVEAAEPPGSLGTERLGAVLSELSALSLIDAAPPGIADPARVPLSTLFSVVYGSNLELNRLKRVRDGVNFVSRSALNNGISARVAPIMGLAPIEPGVLTVAGGGSVLETFYQSEPFYSGRDLYYLRPLQPMTPEEMLFYAHCIRANRYRYSYGRQANRTLRDILVPSHAAIPSWVYGAFERIASDILTRHVRVPTAAPS